MDEDKRKEKKFIDPVTTGGILVMILKPMMEAIISFFCFKILQTWWDKYGKERWEKICNKFKKKKQEETDEPDDK